MKRHNVILESNVEPKDNNVLWLQGNKLKKFGNTGWENIIEGDVVTTDRIENEAVTTDKIASSAFDSTLSMSEKIAPADIVGNKLTKLDEKVDALAIGKFYGYFPDSTSLPADVSIPGYAYIRLDNSYKIWNFSGESWSDSGVSIDENDVIITTNRIEDGAVTSEKIATNAFDPTLSVSGKIAPADVVGTRLNELGEEIKSNKSIPTNAGGYFISYTIGAIPTFVENGGYRYAQYECFEGQVFKIKGVGANAARLWYTLNADGKIVRNAASAETSLQEVTIESGEVVIGYNSGVTTTYTFELTTSVPVIAQDIINDYNEKISKAISYGKDFVRTKVFEPVQGKYFNNNGTLSISQSFSYLIIPKSDIITDVLSWYPSARGNSTISSVVYFGADGSVLGNSLTNTFFASVSDFPDGTDSIGFSIQNSSMADGKFTVFGVKNNMLLSEFNETTFPFGGKTGIVFGDSIMNGVGTEVGYDAPNVMQDYMHCRIYNGGVGGATYKLLTHIVDGFLNNDWTYVDSEIERVSSSSSLRPLQVLPKRYATIKNLDLSNIDFLVFAYGTNDWTSDMVLDNESNPMDTETILGCIRSSVSRLQSAYPNIEIFIITPSYRVISRDSNGDVLTDSDNVRHQGLLLGELSDKIMECAKTLKLPCWNQYWDNGVNRYNATKWLSDGTHRTKEGYRLLGRQIADFMNTH